MLAGSPLEGTSKCVSHFTGIQLIVVERFGKVSRALHEILYKILWQIWTKVVDQLTDEHRHTSGRNTANVTEKYYGVHNIFKKEMGP